MLRRKRYQLLLLTVFLVSVGAAWKFCSAAAGPLELKPKAPRPVPTAAAQPLSDVQEREFPGKVRARQRVELAFSVAGALTALDAAEGRIVRQGEVVARLDDRDYKNALDAAESSYVDAKLNFERTGELRKQKVVAEAEYDSAKATYEAAAAERRIRAKAFEDTVLRAPFDGAVASRYVENHEHVQAKQAIVSLQNLSSLEVVIQVPERLVARGGRESLKGLKVRLDADETRWFDAAVREFSSQADSVTRTYEFVLDIAPPADLQVLPGMTATVRAGVKSGDGGEARPAGATLVPAEAVFAGPDGKFYVWLIEDGGTHPKKLAVETGSPRNAGIEILSGLKPGQRVAVAGVNTLREEMLVRPMRAGREGLDG